MRDVRWGWIVLAAFLGELAGLAVLMGIRVLHGYSPVALQPLSTIGTAAFLIELAAVMAVGGWWVATRKARSQRVVHGLLVGVAAVLLYEVLTFRAPIPVDWLYIAAHVAKIAGGGFGGWVAARRASPVVPTVATPL